MTPEQITIRILLDILAERGGITQQDRDRLNGVLDIPQVLPPLPTIPSVLSSVCNKCGRSFEYGKAYGMVCVSGCPMGMGPVASSSARAMEGRE